MEECLKQFPYDGKPHLTTVVKEEGPMCTCNLARGHGHDVPHQCCCGFEWYEQFVPLPKSQDRLLGNMVYDIKVDAEVRELLTLLRIIWGRLPHGLQEQAKKVEDMLG